jgi:hypothetical protein
LREVRLFTFEIIDFKECRGSFTGRRRKYWRVAERKAVIIKKAAHCLNHGVTHLQDRMLSSRTQPEVSVIHQELSAVFLWCDRIIVNFLKDLGVQDIDFVTARGASIGAHSSSD